MNKTDEYASHSTSYLSMCAVNNSLTLTGAVTAIGLPSFTSYHANAVFVGAPGHAGETRSLQ